MFIGGPVRIEGGSMEPTLHDGDVAIASRVDVWLERAGLLAYRRGDVVHFTDPSVDGTFGPQVVKRIVGVAGDRVAVRDGRVVLNGVPTLETYLGGHPVLGADAAAVLVPPGTVYVLGDARAPLASRDSRVYGPVPVERIWGRVALRAELRPSDGGGFLGLVRIRVVR